MTILLLKGFNNYYNRIRKGYPAQGYKDAVGTGNWWEYFDINFYQNDGVETTQTINFTTASPAPDGVPDYLVAFYPDSTSENPHVHSRWFVLECKHNRKNQFILTLRRDLFIDFATEIDDAQAYIEKGALTYTSSSNFDKGLYNSEDFSCSWVKEGQWNIGGSAHYIVAYVASDGNLYQVKEHDSLGQENIIMTLNPDRANCRAGPYSLYVWETPIPATVGAGGISKMRACLKLAALMSASLSGAGALYDIQILPFPPADYSTASSQSVEVSGQTISVKNCTRDTFSDAQTITDLPAINSALSAKTVNQCYKLVLTGPNGSNAFEFNKFKVGSFGTSLKLNMYITLKPISPYIHIYPDFGGLYKANYPYDYRGLVVQADFSLPTLTSQWLDFEVNNKNYLNSFNRETESIELQNKWALATDISSAVGGTISGAVGGAALGGVGGAIAGGVGSAITGAIGVAGNEIMRQDALDLRKDQFNYSLENIKARPVQLTRVSGLTDDSILCPMVELYKATDTEITAFQNKIKYNGMKIMRIGRIGDYRSHLNSSCKYMKCKLIYINIKDDYHVASEIGRELDKGFYIP